MLNINDRVPPCDIRAECAVLGAMMLPEESKAAIETVTAEGLKSSDFYKEFHRRIFRTIIKLHQKQEPVDLLSVTRELEKSGELRAGNMVCYLDELIDATPSAANVGYYANQVKNTSNLRSIIYIGRTVNEKAYEPDAEPSRLLAELERLIRESQLTESISGKIPNAQDDWPEIYERLSRSQKRKFLGLLTGFNMLDEVTLGLRGLSVIGGTPGQGKTSFALQLATKIAEDGNPVLFYALEMSKFDLYVKAISQLSRLDNMTLMIGSEMNGKRGQGLSPKDKHNLDLAIERFMEFAHLLRIVDPSVCRNISLSMVDMHIRQVKQEHNAQCIFVVVDHLQIFPCQNPGMNDMKLRLDYLMAEFKAMSERHNAVILLVSEKNRASYSNEWLGAYMGSAGIEYGVDLGLLLHEEDEERGNPDARDIERNIELWVVKNRFGCKAVIRMIFCPEISMFVEEDHRGGRSAKPKANRR
jgi:replicative DNA helicase